MKFDLNQREALNVKSEPWNFETDGDAVEFEKAMIEFMLENNGLGLAANQIGIAKRVFVMGSHTAREFPKPFAVFNPKILKTSEKTLLDTEGCLSYPGLWLNIQRPEEIEVEYQDSQGKVHQTKFEGYVARCFLHEYDHLDGVCFVDIVSPLKLKLAYKKMRKILK